MGHSSTMCLADWVWCPQSHCGVELNPHWCIMSPIRPCPVLSLFRAIHCLLGRLNPGGCIIGWSKRWFESILLDLQSSVHLDIRSNFSVVSYPASFQVGFLDFNLCRRPALVQSLWIGSVVFLRHLVHSWSNEFIRRRFGGAMLHSKGSH